MSSETFSIVAAIAAWTVSSGGSGDLEGELGLNIIGTATVSSDNIAIAVTEVYDLNCNPLDARGGAPNAAAGAVSVTEVQGSGANVLHLSTMSMTAPLTLVLPADFRAAMVAVVPTDTSTSGVLSSSGNNLVLTTAFATYTCPLSNAVVDITGAANGSFSFLPCDAAYAATQANAAGLATTTASLATSQASLATANSQASLYQNVAVVLGTLVGLLGVALFMSRGKASKPNGAAAGNGGGAANRLNAPSGPASGYNGYGA